MALECTAKQMIDMLDEHLPYDVAMMLVTHDILYTRPKIADQFSANVVIESFCLHARNLFEFLTRKEGGGKNYAFAKAYVPTFDAFRDSEARAEKDDLYRKICAQITHLSFNRVKDVGKVRPDVEVPKAASLLVTEIKAFAKALPCDGHRRAWEAGMRKSALSLRGF